MKIVLSGKTMAFRHVRALKPSHSATPSEDSFPDILPRKAEKGVNHSPLQPSSSGGTLSARLYAVNTAIPVLQERISPVLDTATRLLVVTCRRGRELKRKEVVLGLMPTEELVGSIVELRVDLVLCAALSEALHRALKRRGIRVRRHLCGPIDAILQAFRRGQLDREEFRMPGCWRPKVHAEPDQDQRPVKLPGSGRHEADTALEKTQA
jgi:predicted Fe-Mo cluster-binding NifX family protein